MYNELEGVTALLSNVTLAGQWLRQMGEGASNAGVSIQLCMAYPRHALASLEMPTATQIRASDDHVPGWDVKVQWNLGYSSILAWAVGLAPFKDNFWSTAVQPGSSCGSSPEITPSLHHAASVFSAGPVTPGDGVGFSDVSQIMRGCTTSGLLLQPSRPATAIDRNVASKVFPAAPGSFAGEVFATYSLVGGLFFDHVLVAEATNGVAITTADFAGIRADSALRVGGAVSVPGPAVAYAINATSFDVASLVVRAFDDATPLTVEPCGLEDFAVWHTAPLFGTWALLGDLSKFVPVAEMRFSNLQVTATGASVDVTGSPGETVPVTFWSTATNATVVAVCVLDDAERATATTDGVCA